MLEGYLDIMYGKGEGVPEDDVKGYSWMNLSAPQRNDNAVEEILQDTIKYIILPYSRTGGGPYNRTLPPLTVGLPRTPPVRTNLPEVHVHQLHEGIIYASILPDPCLLLAQLDRRSVNIKPGEN